MNISNVTSSLANAITPFAATEKSEVTNPVNASPMPPVKPSEQADKPSIRDQKSAPQQKNSEAEAEDPESETDAAASEQKKPSSISTQGMSEQELATLMQLKSRDREVRSHEQAHQSVGGQYAGSASFEYQTGPDGSRYAVGGEVPIRMPVADGAPAEKIRQADQIIRAALAPAEPSSQDRAVAMRAMQLKQEAQSELRQQQSPAGEENKTSADSPNHKFNIAYRDFGGNTVGSNLSTQA